MNLNPKQVSVGNRDLIRNFTSGMLYDGAIQKKNDSLLPKISIIIPSFNQAEYLERTILSILNQNYPNVELIVIDGGSRDGSIDIIKKYETYISHWESGKDDGQAAAINKGFRMATGEVVAWQNSDDVYLPGVFNRITSEFQADEGQDVVYGNVYLIDTEDNIIKEMRFMPFSISYLIYYGWNLSSQAVFLKRELFEKIGYLDESLEIAFDWDWFIRLGLSGARMKFIHEFFGAYRIHVSSKFSKIPPSQRVSIEHSILVKNRVSTNAFKIFFYKRAMFFWKLFYYLMQGDYEYIMQGLERRIKKIT